LSTAILPIIDESVCHDQSVQAPVVLDEINVDHTLGEIPQAVGWLDLIGIVQPLDPHDQLRFGSETLKLGDGLEREQNKGLAPEADKILFHWLVYSPEVY
jgi:hypothetical protein